MFKSTELILCLFMPLRVAAWDDDAVLNFIIQANPPILQAQRNVTQAFAEPDAMTWVLQNTSVSGQLRLGGTISAITLTSSSAACRLIFRCHRSKKNAKEQELLAKFHGVPDSQIDWKDIKSQVNRMSMRDLAGDLRPAQVISSASEKKAKGR